MRHARKVYFVHVIRRLGGIGLFRGLDKVFGRAVLNWEKGSGVPIWEKCELHSAF